MPRQFVSEASTLYCIHYTFTIEEPPDPAFPSLSLSQRRLFPMSVSLYVSLSLSLQQKSWLISLLSEENGRAAFKAFVAPSHTGVYKSIGGMLSAGGELSSCKIPLVCPLPSFTRYILHRSVPLLIMSL